MSKFFFRYLKAGRYPVNLTVQTGPDDPVDPDCDPWTYDFDDLCLEEPEKTTEELLDIFRNHHGGGSSGPTTVPQAVAESVEDSRRRLGLCPSCGTKGPFVNMTMTCPEHGPY